jgi:hypothetical protein
MRFVRKPVAIVAAGLFVFAGAGAAYAAWSSSGSGSGGAKAISAQSITVTAATPSTGDMYPGGPAGTIDFTLSNPNPYPVILNSVSYGSTGDSKISVAWNAPKFVSFQLPAHASNVAEHINGVLEMSSSANDSYQGKSFNVAITLSGSQD